MALIPPKHLDILRRMMVEEEDEQFGVMLALDTVKAAIWNMMAAGT